MCFSQVPQKTQRNVSVVWSQLLIVLFRTYSYQFVNVPTHFHTGEYNLMKKEDGNISHLVKIKSLPNQTYTVTLMDKNSAREIGKASNIADLEILFEWLKPCTNYTVSVNGCEPNGSRTFTSSGKCFTLAVKTYSNSKLRWDILYTDLKKDLDT